MDYAALREYALSLPEVTEEPHFRYQSFRVRGKIFMTVPPENTHIHVFVPEEDREQALALHPDAAEKLFWGKKAVGLRVTLDAAPTAWVEELAYRAWTLKAPKSLSANRGD